MGTEKDLKEREVVQELERPLSHSLSRAPLPLPQEAKLSVGMGTAGFGRVEGGGGTEKDLKREGCTRAGKETIVLSEQSPLPLPQEAN